MAKNETQVKQKPSPQKTLKVSSLLDSIIQETSIKPEDEAYRLIIDGLKIMFKDIVDSDAKDDKISKAIVEKIIAKIDEGIGKQLDEIMHASEFQKIESSWRSLKFLVDRTDFRENIKIEFFNVSKDDLLEDFEDSPEVVKSGLYKTVYTGEYGQFGGKPYGNIIGNYEFGPGPRDMKLLKYLAQVASMSHAPFIGAASVEMFTIDSFKKLPMLKELETVFGAPQYASWRGLRETEEARYVGLTLPRFLLRLPYGEDTERVKTFNYEEKVSGDHEHYLWGNTAFAFATRLTESFAQYRWCTSIIGPKGGGAVKELPIHLFDDMGTKQQKIPTEILISERREYELAEEGFIGLTMRKGEDNAAFFSANSIQKPKKYPKTEEGEKAQVNYALSTQLPYMYITNRLAHYIKVMQRENIGTWKEASDLERGLNDWIRQYVADMDNPMPGVRSRRPLRAAKIIVENAPGEPGWYKVSINVRPHYKYMGAYFTLSLVGKLEKE